MRTVWPLMTGRTVTERLAHARTVSTIMAHSRFMPDPAQRSDPAPGRSDGAAPARKDASSLLASRDLEQLYRDDYSQLLAFARIRIGNAADASDLVHDAFLAVRRAYPDKRGEELRRLIYTALRNRTNDHLKSHDTKRRKTSVEIGDCGHLLPCSTSVTPEKRLIDTQTLRLVSQAMEEMSPRQREVLHLRRYEGLTVEAVAARLSISQTTAKTDLMAAMKTIARSIERAEGRRR